MLAVLDPFSGVAGDMFLGALVDLGLDPAFLEQLPEALGLENIGVRIARVQRCGIAAVKVDFDIPPQPHGRHLKHLIEIVERSMAPASVKARASAAFRSIATVEAQIHGTTVERVHLHEVGAVDAILDVIGTLWGIEKLGITDVCCGPIALGDGFVLAAHGMMPVPAPATAKLLEGLTVSPGPSGTGELTTPTGAALVQALAARPLPASYVPRRVGYGAGTKEFTNRANVFRVTLADASPAHTPAHTPAHRERVVQLSADIDDMSPEDLAAAVDELRAANALDVTLTNVIMKKGRAGTRLDVLSTPETADALEEAILMKTSSIGVRRADIFRRVLPRRSRVVVVMGHEIRLKTVLLPDGSERVKPESDDVSRVTIATGLARAHICALAVAEAPRSQERV